MSANDSFSARYGIALIIILSQGRPGVARPERGKIPDTEQAEGGGCPPALRNTCQSLIRVQ